MAVDYKTLQPFRYWCQKVLPLVYDDSLSYYELLCKVVDYLNKTMEDVETLHDDVDALADAYESLQNYVNNYFDNLDVQEEINAKLDAMASDGSLTALINPLIPDAVSDWLEEHITPTTPAIDDSLTVSGAGADAKTVGDIFKDMTETTPNIWGLGNQSITNTSHVTVNNINIPAGTYTISALVEDSTNAPRNCRFRFYKTSVSQANELATDAIPAYARGSATFTLAEKADIVEFYYGVSSGQTGTAVWKDIQIEEGSVATDYSAPITAIDYYARDDNEKTQADLDSAEDLLDDVTENTRNLWLYGDQAIVSTTSKTVTGVNFPAGTYTISALITDTANDPRNARICFYKGSVTVANRLANPGIATYSRNSATITLSDTADIVVFQWGASATQSGSCTWTDIQIERGSVATPYVRPISAIDNIAREDIKVYDSIHELVGTHSAGTTIKVKNILPSDLCHPMIICADAKYTQSDTTAYPYITTSIITDRGLERTSMRYKIGEKDVYSISKIRAVPFIWDNRAVTLNLVVPSGCSLTIRNIYCYFERSRNNTTGGVQFLAHDGACNIAPEQTLCAYKMAFESGYNSAVVIPKITSDGVWFAYHDDTFDIDTTILKNPDGTSISSSDYDGMYFNQIPWSYLSQFKVGNYGAMFDDVGLMKLEDFLSYCAMTGMTPVFSMHPRYGVQTTENLTALKAMVNKYGLLSKLVIKMPVVKDDNVYTLSNFTTIFGIFGNDISEYVAGASSDMATPSDMITLFNAVSSTCTTKMTIEYWAAQILSNTSIVGTTITGGYAVSCCSGTYTDISGTTLNVFTSEMVKYMVSLGVTEFTEQYNTSNGLYW